VFEVQPPNKSHAIPVGHLFSSLYLDQPIVAYLKKSKTWYPGKIWFVNENGSFDVLFEDGDRRTCLPAPLVRWSPTDSTTKPPTPSASAIAEGNKATYTKGDAVRVRFRGGWKYFAGTITNTTGTTCDVQYDDDEIETNVQTSMLCKLSKHKTSSECDNRLGLAQGTFVEAKYNKGKQWFRGNLKKLSATAGEKVQGTYTIQYEDGDHEVLKRRHLWVVRKTSTEGRKEFGKLVPGQQIKARYGRGIEWFEGKIIQKQEGTDSYDIVYSDGDMEKGKNLVLLWWSLSGLWLCCFNICFLFKGIPRWLITEIENTIVVEGEFLWKSMEPITHDNGQDYVLQMYEIDGSTEIYLFIEDPTRNVLDNGAGEPLARLSISDDDVLKILEAGGMTDEQMNKLETPQDLCQAVSDLIGIKGDVGSFSLDVE
jgi:hypothetical protein